MFDIGWSEMAVIALLTARFVLQVVTEKDIAVTNGFITQGDTGDL